MSGRAPSAEVVDRYTRAVRGIERIILGKAGWLVRRTSGLSAAEVREIALLLAEATAGDQVGAR
jgi:hypothetical protein